MKVRIESVDVAIEGALRVAGASFEVASGEVVALIGPNGSGKSTLLRTMYRALRPTAGRVVIGDDDLRRLTARESARRVAAVLQDDAPDFEFTVRELVSLGRVPHHRMLGAMGSRDVDAVDGALATVGARDLADREISSLSGGERQRVYVARALAQQTPVLVLDEPTNHLDLLAQLELLELLRAIPGTVLVALHDLGLAAAYCDTVIVMSAGLVVAVGPPADVLTPALVAQVYGVRAVVGTHPVTGAPVLHFDAPVRRRGRQPVTASMITPDRSEPRP